MSKVGKWFGLYHDPELKISEVSILRPGASGASPQVQRVPDIDFSLRYGIYSWHDP